MKCFTVDNRGVHQGLRILPPHGDIGWHLRIGSDRDDSMVLPVCNKIDELLGRYREELRAVSKAPAHRCMPLTDINTVTKNFRGTLPGEAASALKEVEDRGWPVDDLAILIKGTAIDATLIHSATKDLGPCLVHLQFAASEGKLELYSIKEGEDIADVERLMPFYGGSGANGTPEHLFRMDPGCEFRVGFHEDSRWNLATVSWSGSRLRLLREETAQMSKEASATV